MDAIIYIHQGDSSYLEHIFALTRRNNPYQRIILLGDATNRKYTTACGIEFHDIQPFIQPFPYKHQSVNTYDYEYFCYERWIILNNFLRSAPDIVKLIYSDSDNAILENIGAFVHHYSNLDIGYLGIESMCVPNMLYIHRDCCQPIVDYIYGFYTPDHVDSHIQTYIRAFQFRINNVYHISDMFTLLDAFKNIVGQAALVSIPGLQQTQHTMQNLQQQCNDIMPDIMFNSSIESVKNNYRVTNNAVLSGEKKLFNLHFSDNNKDTAAEVLHKMNTYAV